MVVSGAMMIFSFLRLLYLQCKLWWDRCRAKTPEKVPEVKVVPRTEERKKLLVNKKYHHHSAHDEKKLPVKIPLSNPKK